MATAAELLASSQGVDDTTLVIDNYFRTITIPKKITNIGVESDDDVLRLNFKMPRYLDDTDLSAFSIRINYLNAEGEGDAYTVGDKTVTNDSIKFSWLVGPHATAYKGTVHFNVCMKIVDGNGYIQKEYNTTVATLPVLEGLETDERIISEYTDILEQWKRELFGIGDTEEASMRAVSQEEQENIAEKGREVLATIPEDYQTTYQRAEEGVRTKADAIICTAQGDVISISDSSDDYIRGIRVFGKTTQVTTTGTNLFNPYAAQNNSFGDATVENNGARITVTGTYYVSWPLVLKAGVTYYINFDTVGAATNRAVRFEYPDKEITGTVTNPASFTPTKDTVSVYLYSGLGTEGTIIYENVQISEGSSAITWEPYSGGVTSPSPDWPQPIVDIEKPTIDIYGKNLAVQNYTLDYTIKGIRIATLGNTSEVLINGTAESLFSYTVLRTKMLPPGTYTVSATGVNKHDDGHDRLYIADYYTGRVYANYLRDGSPKTITILDHTRLCIDMVFKEGTVYNNATLKIQIEPGTANTEYEQCKVVQSVSVDRSISGIPVASGGNYTDASGQQWICDEIDFERGVHIQRCYAETLTFTYQEGLNRYTANLTHTANAAYGIEQGIPVLSSELPFDPACGSGNPMINGIRVATSSPKYAIAYYNGDVIEDVDVIYPLATPIETPLTAEELEAFNALKTNYPHTTLMNDAGAWMELTYNVDTKTYVDNNIRQSLTNVLEAIENGSY